MQKEKICGNTATGTLKLIALLFMLTDHAGAAFFNGKAGFLPYVPEMRAIGRLAFPIYVWCLCVGTEYTRDLIKYLLRMLLLAVISQPFYSLAMGHEWYQMNIFATLSLGLAAVIGIRMDRYFSCYWGPVLCILVSFVVPVDYGWQGVMFIILMYLCRKEKGTLCAFMIAFCLFWGQTSGSGVSRLFGVSFPQRVAFLPNADRFFSSVFRIQTFAVFALPFMLIPMKNIRISKWAAYSVYPAHLLIIWLIKLIFGLV